MKFNKTILEQKLELDVYVENWTDTGLLDNIDDYHTKCVTAVIMDNQKIFNESATMNELQGRISIPIIRRVMGGLETKPFIYDMIFVQPMLGPAVPIIVCNNDGDPIYADYYAAARTRMAKVTVPDSTYLDTSIIEYISSQLRDEIFIEITTDLNNNVGTLIEVNEIDYMANIKEAITSIQNKLVNFFYPGLNEENHQKMVEKLKKRIPGNYFIVAHPKHEEYLKIFEFKKSFHKYLPEDSILIGFKGDQPHQSGYVWMPYVLLSLCETTIDPQHQKVLMRYSKKLFKGGSGFYAKIKIKGNDDGEKEKPLDG